MALPEQATKDGFDVQMQTNHLSHFLLTSLLLPDLEKAVRALPSSNHHII
jgi:NAD(P)-dependent dehydrogenase (short-subunit alcohol dehydrogenase family)